MATKAEIRNKTLIKLGVLSADGTAEADDATLIEEKYDDLYQYLVRKKVATWGPTDEVPDGSIEPLVVVLASRCLTDFDVPEKYVTIIAGTVRDSWKELEQLAAIPYESHETAANYY